MKQNTRFLGALPGNAKLLDGYGFPNVTPRKAHAYAAGFGDDFAREQILAETTDGELILDPFAGAATTLVQARLLGRQAIGVDVDPVACLIGRVLVSPYSLEVLASLGARVERFLTELGAEGSKRAIEQLPWNPGDSNVIGNVMASVPANDQISYWFAPVQRAALALLRGMADTVEDASLRDIVYLTISSSIIRKWPNTISLARDIDHSRPHKTLREGLSLANQLAIFRRVFKSVLKIVSDLNTFAPSTHGYIHVVQADCGTYLRHLNNSSIDYVVTSPPYFTAIDYPRAHRFSQWWLWPNMDRLSRQQYIGLKSGVKEPEALARSEVLLSSTVIAQINRLAEKSNATMMSFYKYILDMDSIITEVQRLLKPGKRATFVIGNNVIRGTKVPVVEAFGELCCSNGFIGVEIVERNISPGKRRYPYGLTGFKGLMNKEYIVHSINGG